MNGNLDITGSIQKGPTKRYISQPDFQEYKGILLPSKELIELHSYPERLEQILDTEVFKKRADGKLSINKSATTDYIKTIKANLPLLILQTGTPVEVFRLEGMSYNRNSLNEYFDDIGRGTPNRTSEYKKRIKIFLEDENIKPGPMDYLVYNSLRGRGLGVSLKKRNSPILINAVLITDFLK